MPSRFDYVKYDNAAVVDQGEAKELVALVEHLIEEIRQESKDAGRACALAFTKLEGCYMWIGKAIRDSQIARNGSAPLQEERTNS